MWGFLSMNKQFNEIKWLEKYVGKSIEKANLQNIHNFVFFWSLFESKVCKNSANVNSICDKVDELASKGRLSIVDYNEFYKYFKERYVSSGKVNYKFNSLSFRSNDKKELVKKVLESDECDTGIVIKALLIIVYRLRNNLFHGTKRIETLDTQIDNFKITNKLLATVIEQYDQS